MVTLQCSCPMMIGSTLEYMPIFDTFMVYSAGEITSVL